MNQPWKKRCVAALLAVLLFPASAKAGRFVEVTAEVTFDNWEYRALCDGEAVGKGDKDTNLIGITQTRQIIVGTNSWMESSTVLDDTTTNWFTGTNIVEYTVNTNDTAGGHSFPAVTRRRGRSIPSVDGNPDTARIMGIPDVTGKVCWLAFCSGPCFKNPEHKIYPPGPFWVESSAYKADWKEWSKLFVDDLGLPQAVQLITTNKQIVFEYHVHQTTNVLGWTFPLTFYGIQYIDTRDKGWSVDLIFKGRVTAIRETTEPQIPGSVWKAVH